MHLKLLDRMEALLNLVENSVGDCTKTDDAEHSADSNRINYSDELKTI